MQTSCRINRRLRGQRVGRRRGPRAGLADGLGTRIGMLAGGAAADPELAGRAVIAWMAGTTGHFSPPRARRRGRRMRSILPGAAGSRQTASDVADRIGGLAASHEARARWAPIRRQVCGL